MKKYLTFFVVFGYILLSGVMHPHLWQQLWNDESLQDAVYGEVTAASWGMEQLYQNIKTGQNPFAYRDGQLYPFGNSLLSTDSGNGFFFLLLRPWLSIHQSLSIIVVASVVMACLGMYLLLTQLGVKRGIAFVLGAAFGFTTVLQPRMGHLTYMSIYVFPWFFYAVFRIKPILAGVILALALYHNLYYFVMLMIMSGWLLGYRMWTERQSWWKKFLIYRQKLGIFLGSCVLLLSPWIIMFGKVQKFEGLPKTVGWGGAIDFSADLFGVFVPSVYSRFLGGLTERVGAKMAFAWGIFEQHIYPGLIIIFGIALLMWQWRKLQPKIQNEIKPWLSGVILFWILTLGPFLHVFGKWRLNLEGIFFVIPLPFALLHYLPFMSNIRSPGRLAIGLVFFSYVAIGLWLSKRKWLKNKYCYVGLIGLLSLIFVLDHPFIYTPAKARKLPSTLYETIKRDQEFFSVYEMPSAVRDGFKYFGNLESLDFINGQLIHRKPVLAGYFGRVNDFKREYFASNPFFGYMGRLMDVGVEHNGAIDRTELPKWQEVNIEGSRQALDLLATKYVVLKNEQFYSASASAALVKLDFHKISEDSGNSLWKRELSENECKEVLIGQAGDEMYLGIGWRGRDKDFRYMGKTGSVMFRLSQPRPMKLQVTGAAYGKPQTAQVYLNQRLIGEMNFGRETATHELNIGLVPAGLTTIHIIFPHAYPLDGIMLSAKIMRVSLEELND